MKRIITLLLTLLVGVAVYASDCGCDEQVIAREHMFCEKVH